MVSEPGNYSAEVMTECETIEIQFNILEFDCAEVIYAANIFSPNQDGVNDVIEFHINPIITIEGSLQIYDRWGYRVFDRSTDQELKWDGNSTSGSPLSSGVYVWVFTSSDSSISQSGNITLIR